VLEDQFMKKKKKIGFGVAFFYMLIYFFLVLPFGFLLVAMPLSNGSEFWDFSV
jgi:hypothetical protein